MPRFRPLPQPHHPHRPLPLALLLDLIDVVIIINIIISVLGGVLAAPRLSLSPFGVGRRFLVLSRR